MEKKKDFAFEFFLYISQTFGLEKGEILPNTVFINSDELKVKRFKRKTVTALTRTLFVNCDSDAFIVCTFSAGCKKKKKLEI